MRYFAYDGRTTHGPSAIDELLKLPGFDGDTLVCPVGSNDTADWKPALAYPPFKKALLEPSASAPLAPTPAAGPALAPLGGPTPLAPPPSARPPMPAPAQAEKKSHCPLCAHLNLADARYCNSCGGRMDAGPAPVPAPQPVLPAPAEAAPMVAPPPFSAAELPATSAAPAPASNPFAHLDPMLSFPSEGSTIPASEPPPGPKPGGMGRLAQFEEPVTAMEFTRPTPSLAPDPTPEPLAPVPVAAVALWKKPPVLAAIAAALVVAGALAYKMVGKAPIIEPVAELTPSAPATPAPDVMPVAPAPTIYSAPPQTSSPSIPLPRTAKVKRGKKPKLDAAPVSGLDAAVAPKPKRIRKARRAAVPKPEPTVAQDGGGETMIESRAPEPKPKKKGKRAAKAGDGEKDPLLESLLADATQTSGETAVADPSAPGETPAEKPVPQIGQRAAAKPEQFSLPGLERKVAASDRRAPQVKAPVNAPDESGVADATPVEDPKAVPPTGIENEPVKPATEADQLALVQVHEQFDFCTQLLSQGAFGDHYDTCLCKDAREASPYRGRRGFYVSAKKKEVSAGQLATSAKIIASKLDAGVAKVTARWSSGIGDKGRTSSQTWKLEDGLWCQAP